MTDNIYEVLRATGGIPTSEEARELARKRAAGDMAARERLITGNLPLVTYAIERMNVHQYMIDDAFQAGTIGLIYAADHYDPEHDRRAAFGSYAFWWIRNHVQRVTRPMAKVAVHEQPLDPNAAYEFTVEHHFNEDEIDVSPVLRMLTKRERSVLRNVSLGLTLREIGNEMGISRERVRQLRVRAVHKLKGMIR